MIKICVNILQISCTVTKTSLDESFGCQTKCFKPNCIWPKQYASFCILAKLIRCNFDCHTIAMIKEKKKISAWFDFPFDFTG